MRIKNIILAAAFLPVLFTSCNKEKGEKTSDVSAW